MNKNDFKSKYSQDMEELSPAFSTRAKILSKAQNTTGAIPARRRTAFRLVAAALCAVVLLGALSIPLFNRGDDNKTNTKPLPTTLGNNNGATLSQAGSYKDVYLALSSGKEDGRGNIKGDNSNQELALGQPEIHPGNDGNFPSSVPSDNEMQSSKDNDYSDTNNQVRGVQEGDIVKTDGKYIYTTYTSPEYFTDGVKRSEIAIAPMMSTKKNTVYIASASEGNLKLVSTIEMRKDKAISYSITEILLYENTLIVIKQGYSNDSSGNRWYGYKQYTAAEIYDITDRGNPIFVNELYQSGYYHTSRMVGNFIYLISNYSDYYSNAKVGNPEDYIPTASAYGRADLIAADQILLPADVQSRDFVVITGIDIENPKDFVTEKAVLGWVSAVYSEGESIYLAMPHYEDIYGKIDNYKVGTKIKIKTQSSFYRFAIEEGKVEFKASVTVDGELINQFAMDEHDGHFRVATTVDSNTAVVEEAIYWNSRGNSAMPGGKTIGESEEKIDWDTPPEDIAGYENGTTKEVYRYFNYIESASYSNLYIFDIGLNQVGFITDLGKTERIYSVRFDGDVGYVVTFLRIDPLYAIDLSNPRSPKVLTELKIPGFSNYLHPYGENLLFGLGMDADSQGSVKGLKLSMFDVKNKLNVVEKSVYKIKGDYSSSEAQYNHKAILVDAAKNLIGFPIWSYNYNSGASEREYHFYSYEKGDFVKKAVITLGQGQFSNELRGLYIGDYAYLISPDRGIISFSLANFEKVDELIFTR